MGFQVVQEVAEEQVVPPLGVVDLQLLVKEILVEQDLLIIHILMFQEVEAEQDLLE